MKKEKKPSSNIKSNKIIPFLVSLLFILVAFLCYTTLVNSSEIRSINDNLNLIVDDSEENTLPDKVESNSLEILGLVGRIDELEKENESMESRLNNLESSLDDVQSKSKNNEFNINKSNKELEENVNSIRRDVCNIEKDIYQFVIC